MKEKIIRYEKKSIILLCLLFVLFISQKIKAQNTTIELGKGFFLNYINDEIKQYPDSVELNILKLDYYFKNNPDEISSEIEKAFKRCGNNSEVMEFLGYSYLGIKQFKQASKYYEKVISLDGENKESYCNLGYCYSELGNYKDAHRSFDSALSIDSLYFEAYFNKGMVFMKESKYDKALKQYQKALLIYPENIDVLYNIGMAYYYKKQYLDAITYLKSYLDYNQNESAYKYLIQAYLRTGNKLKATYYSGEAHNKGFNFE